jgi:hypothetical protein
LPAMMRMSGRQLEQTRLLYLTQAPRWSRT